MFHYTPKNARILLLCDTRTLANANTDATTPAEPGQQAVQGAWWPGLDVWGERGWEGIARCALFEFGAKVTAELREQAKRELRAHLRRNKFETIVVLQSRSKAARKVYDENYAKASHNGTVAWDFFKPPGPIATMSGSFWDTEIPGGKGLRATVLPLQNPQNVDYVYGAMTVRWLRAVRDNVPMFLPPADTTHTSPGLKMAAGLRGILGSTRAGKPIAIDLETYSTKDLITVIGLSDGVTTCAVPWESFVPHGQTALEPGLCTRAAGETVREILACARVLMGHNHIRFDLPYLGRKGIHVNPEAFQFDTYLAHGVLLNQFRHGLQQCVSYEFKTPPWKSLHKAHAAESGLDTDDGEAWIQDPKELRQYNASDTFYTYWLGQRLAEYGGITL